MAGPGQRSASLLKIFGKGLGQSDGANAGETHLEDDLKGSGEGPAPGIGEPRMDMNASLSATPKAAPGT